MTSETVPLDACTPPGIVTVMAAAVQSALRFQTAVPAGWIVVFSWHDGERVRESRDAPWVDKGAGIHIGAYRDEQIPPEVVTETDALRYAVLIRDEILSRYPRKVIDLDGTGNPVLL